MLLPCVGPANFAGIRNSDSYTRALELNRWQKYINHAVLENWRGQTQMEFNIMSARREQDWYHEPLGAMNEAELIKMFTAPESGWKRAWFTETHFVLSQ